MKHKLDIATWPRREHFEFFKTFEEPYHGICTTFDCTAAYNFTKASGISFFLYYTYQSLAAAQQIEAFRLRLEDDEVFVYDRIDGGAAIDRPDGTFGYGYLPYTDSLEDFLATANLEVARIRATTGLPRTTQNNLIRYSVLPWTDFTALTHARLFSRADSCPRITFGKMTQQGATRRMPIAINVNHALVDGLHVAQYLDALQTCMNSR